VILAKIGGVSKGTSFPLWGTWEISKSHCRSGGGNGRVEGGMGVESVVGKAAVGSRVSGVNEGGVRGVFNGRAGGGSALATYIDWRPGGVRAPASCPH